MALALVAVVVAAKILSDRALDLGVAALRIHRFDEADQQFQRAGKWYRRGGEVALLRSRAAWAEGDSERGALLLDLASDEGMAAKRIEQERLLMQIRGGSAGEMRSRLPSMLQRSPQDGPAILEAFTAGFLAHGEADRAAEMLAMWQDADADDPRVYYWRGVLHQTFGESIDAIEHFRAALAVAAEMTPARFALAEILKSHFFYSEALPHYQRVVEEQPGNMDAEVGLGICELRSKLAEPNPLVQLGVERLTAAITSDPDNETARVALAEYYQDQHQPRLVASTLEPLVKSHDDAITVHYLLAAAREARRPEAIGFAFRPL